MDPATAAARAGATRRRRHAVVALGCAGVGASLAVVTGPAQPSAYAEGATLGARAAGAPVLTLPAPENPDLLAGVNIGVKPDRLLVSRVPGSVSNSESVEVRLGPDGTPATVVVEQRMVLTGTGDYVIRERGPARRAEGLGDTVPPVLQRGTVVWQGFVPGRRSLAARLTLDAGLEAPRLPLSVQLSFVPTGAGSPVPIAAGGRVAGGGRLTIHLSNTTTLPGQQVPTADVRASVLAPLLSDLQASAAEPGPRPPVAGLGLPRTVPAIAVGGNRFTDVTAPLHVTGSVRLAPTTAGSPVRVEGPGTTPLADGAQVDGTLSGSVDFAVVVPDGGGTLSLDLTAVPALDGRTLLPPAGAASWARWATTSPGASEREGVVDQLVTAAATTARISALEPYLAAKLHGPVQTSFHLSIAPADAVVVAVKPLHPRPWPIALVTLGLVAAGFGLVRLRLRF